MKKSKFRQLIREYIQEILLEAPPTLKKSVLPKIKSAPKSTSSSTKKKTPAKTTPKPSTKKPTQQTDAAAEAEKKGLQHVGWGKYADKKGNVVAQSKDGKLVFIEKDKNKITKKDAAKMGLKKNEKGKYVDSKGVVQAVVDPKTGHLIPVKVLGNIVKKAKEAGGHIGWWKPEMRDAISDYYKKKSQMKLSGDEGDYFGDFKQTY